MTLIASCNHEVFSGNDLVPVEYDDEEIDFYSYKFVPVTVIAMYCPACAKSGLQEGRLRRYVD